MNKQYLNILIENEVKSSELTKEQIKFLDEVVNGVWENNNGIIYVDGDVEFGRRKFNSIPVQFSVINGFFHCDNVDLVSLKGCPSEVKGEFWCDHNQLTSLDYVPTKIEFIDCTKNPFILNDKLFHDLKRLKKEKIFLFNMLKDELKNDIPIQFGITNETIIEEIWQSYMNILDGVSE